MTIKRHDLAVAGAAHDLVVSSAAQSVKKMVRTSTANASALPSGGGRHVVIQRDCVASEKLLSGGGYLLIRHSGYCYQLRQTAAGKLILTKEPGLEAHVARAIQD